MGIYKGSHEPYDLNLFFEKFVTDVRRIISNGGIHFLGQRVPLRLKCFIADATARAFILHHCGHMADRPCSKCKVSGTYVNTNYFVFNGITILLERMMNTSDVLMTLTTKTVQVHLHYYTWKWCHRFHFMDVIISGQSLCQGG